MFNWGSLLGWGNAADLQLSHNQTGFGMNNEERSWVGSSIALGGILGSIFAGEIKLALLGATFTDYGRNG